MRKYLPAPVVGVVSFILYLANTVFCFAQLLPVAFLKLIIPLKPWRVITSRLLYVFVNNWIFVNNLIMNLPGKIRWDIQGTEGLDIDRWYLILPNHQTWVDSMVIPAVFFRKIPFPKFFMKKELIWVPLLGFSWWALDYPFMKRYSEDTLKKKPHLKGKDIEITRKACEKFRDIPITIVNFIEGTRFTPEKRDSRKVPYRNLLRPKAGGAALVLSTLGSRLHYILNMTIAYPGGDKDFKALLCGNIPEILVRVEKIPLTEELLGDYFNDREYRDRFQEWLNGVWTRKDALLDELLSKKEI
ncbi:MAG TPA: acyltransferase [Spirochaetota bacterium]|nr:acyltransferase [Spirochaetota bacterium]